MKCLRGGALETLMCLDLNSGPSGRELAVHIWTCSYCDAWLGDGDDDDDDDDNGSAGMMNPPCLFYSSAHAIWV